MYRFVTTFEEVRIAAGEDVWVGVDNFEATFERVTSFTVIGTESSLPLTVVDADSNWLSLVTDVGSSVLVVLLPAVDSSIL